MEPRLKANATETWELGMAVGTTTGVAAPSPASPAATRSTVVAGAATRSTVVAGAAVATAGMASLPEAPVPYHWAVPSGAVAQTRKAR